MANQEIGKQLDRLYRDIHQCHLCPKMDRKKELRRSDATDPHADVFIISQALAEKTLRMSGVQFFTEKGKLGSTGTYLEKFLNKFKRTVFPPSLIELGSAVQIPARATGFLTAYNTDITYCYPGKTVVGKRGDRKPLDSEVLECKNAGFVRRELEIIKPKLILLMGTESRNAFFRYYMESESSRTGLGLERHINQIVEQGMLPQFHFGPHIANVCPIYHASGLNPRFWKMLENEKLISLLSESLS